MWFSVDPASSAISQFIANWNGVPEPASSTKALFDVGIDPGAFQDSQPLRDALEQVRQYLEPFAGDNATMAKLASLPNVLNQRIANLVGEINTAVMEMMSAWNIQQPSGVVPRRIPPNRYSDMAVKVRERHADLFQLLDPLREVRPGDIEKELGELRELIVKSSLERKSAEGTTEKLQEVKKEAAAFVLSKENVAEIDNAIAAHARSAKQWRWVLLISAIVAFRIAWWLNVPGDKLFWGWGGPVFPVIPDHPEYLDVLANLGRKVLLVSAAFAVPFLALRVYQINLHNLIVNRQRKIAVVTFTELYALMENADAATRIELVKMSAQTIFGQGATGFLTKQRYDFGLVDLTKTILSSSPKG